MLRLQQRKFGQQKNLTHETGGGNGLRKPFRRLGDGLRVRLSELVLCSRSSSSRALHDRESVIIAVRERLKKLDSSEKLVAYTYTDYL